ncbi:MAG: helix-turn-helix domain-containing protein [Planctomycetes bacterium]|nr:helix-turn-helix domain-containing protein [Planctomycetota bacterium]
MAKMFYTLEETQEILGRSDEQIKALVQEGMLREFRDGAKIMYKVDEVDGIASGGVGEGDSGVLPIADDTGEPLDLAGGDSGDDIDLLAGSGDDEIDLLAGSGDDEIDLMAGSGDDEIDLMAGSGEDFDLKPSDTGDQINLEDSADILGGDKDDTVITSHGTNALTESGEIAGDPLAEAPGDLEDQIDLDSSSSGSGLLDLSREADDTSLGAELLEEIYPDAAEGAIETQVPGGLDMAPEGDSMMAAEIQAPPVADYIQPIVMDDPTSGPFGAMLVVPLIMLVMLAFVATAAHAGVRPQFLDSILDYIWIVVGGAAGLSILFVVVGLAMVNKSSGPAKAAEKKPKEKKAKKAKKAKKEKKAKKKK